MDDIHALDGPRFMRMAWRISTYGGVMEMRLREQQAAENPPAPEPRQAPKPTPARSVGRSGGEAKRLASAAAVHPDIFDVRRAR